VSPALPIETGLHAHVKALYACRACPKMESTPVSGRPVMSKVMLIGQAPGIKEPVLEKPFAWTAGKTMFRWFRESWGIEEEDFRKRAYMAAVCRCYPGKNPKGGDRVPDETEIANCSRWMEREFHLLRPELVIAVGKLAIRQIMEFEKLTEVVGTLHRCEKYGVAFDLAALPHPSGASTWHRMEPGKTLLRQALELAGSHPALQALSRR
jgi:uracil-DNA glycosylase